MVVVRAIEAVGVGAVVLLELDVVGAHREHGYPRAVFVEWTLSAGEVRRRDRIGRDRRVRGEQRHDQARDDARTYRPRDRGSWTPATHLRAPSKMQGAPSSF